MRLVRDHDDVIALAVGLARVYVLIELVDQAKDVAVIFLEELLEVRSRFRARCLILGDAAAHESLVNLAVEIVAIGHQ